MSQAEPQSDDSIDAGTEIDPRAKKLIEGDASDVTRRVADEISHLSKVNNIRDYNGSGGDTAVYTEFMGVATMAIFDRVGVEVQHVKGRGGEVKVVVMEA